MLWSVCQIISKLFQSIVLYSVQTKFLTFGIKIDILQQCVSYEIGLSAKHQLFT